MDQKVVIRFRGKSPLSSASRNHLTTFCIPFVLYACLRLCSAIVHFIRNKDRNSRTVTSLSYQRGEEFSKRETTF